MRRPHAKTIVLTLFVATLLGGHSLEANPPKDAVLMDGLAVLVGSRAGNESDATPIMLSDVKLQAKLMELGVERAKKRKTPLIEARRAVVLITILSAQAKQFQEKVDPKEVANLKRWFTERIGGATALGKMLNQLGMTPNDLDKWLQNMVLASGQIRYIESQVELPTGQEISKAVASKPKSDKESSAGNEFDETRRRIVADRLVQTVRNWLYAVLESANVRIVK